LKVEITLNHSSQFATRNYVLRPLLNYFKQQIQEYCDEQQIPYMIDESNADITVSQRNQVRHEIVMKLSEQELENWQ
jgi:tRNA(Ile)-lysidine synthase TilS/MesJ